MWLSKIFKGAAARASLKQKPVESTSPTQLELKDVLHFDQKAADAVYQALLEGKISEEEWERQQVTFSPRTTWKELAQVKMQLCRVIKSSDEIALKSQEGWRRIETKAGEVCRNPVKNGRPMCMTDIKHLIACLGYGDQIAMISTNPKVLHTAGIEDEPVWYVGMAFGEMDADCFYTERIIDINQPGMVMSVAAAADPRVLYQVLGNNQTERAIGKMGLNVALEEWQNIRTRYTEMAPTIQSVKLLQHEIRQELNIGAKCSQYEER